MFNPDSRYHDLETALHVTASGRSIPYKRRRFLPQGASLPELAVVTVRQGDRLDLIAARAFGDVAQYWRLCDANDAMNPVELTATPGAALKIPVPQL